MKKILLFGFALLFTQMLFGQDRLPLSYQGSLLFEGDKPVTKNEFRQIISKDPTAFAKYRRSKRLKAIGWTMFLGSTIYVLSDEIKQISDPQDESYDIYDRLVGGALISSIAMLISSPIVKKKSVIFYNRNTESNSNTFILPTQNGLSITHTF